MTLVEYFRQSETPEQAIRTGPFAIHPVVVDTSSLVSDVYHKLRHGDTYLSAISRFGSFRLLVPTNLYYEVYRRLPDLGRTEEEMAQARQLWETDYLRLIRWCDLSHQIGGDGRVSAVPHLNDRPLAELATLIAPCYVWSDNYRHLASVGVLKDPNWRALAKAGQMVVAQDSVVLGLALPTSAAADGIRAATAYLMERPALGIAIAIALAAVLGFSAYKLSRPEAASTRHQVLEGAGVMIEQLAPLVRQARDEMAWLRERQLQPASDAGLDVAVGHALAVAPAPMLMRDIQAALWYGKGIKTGVRSISDVLWGSGIFVRNDDGRWQLGYRAAPLIDGQP